MLNSRSGVGEVISATLQQFQIRANGQPILYRFGVSEAGDVVHTIGEMHVTIAAGCTDFVLDLGEVDASAACGSPFMIPNASFGLTLREGKWLSTPKLDQEDLPHGLYIRDNGGRVDVQKMDERVQKLNEIILSVMKLVMDRVNLPS